MGFSPSSPVTGGAQTGLTSPTYTIVSATAPDTNGKQFAVTALGGTQTGVTAHSVARPFTTTAWIPKTFKVLGTPNPATGVIPNVPNNEYKIITRKGVLPLVDQPNKVAHVTTTIAVPAGADATDPEDIRAMLSLHFGILSAESADIGDMVIDGLL